MAQPHPTAKKSVNLASSPASNLASSATSLGPRVSRIRRDPPPVAEKEEFVDPKERDQWAMAVGILTFALAIAAIALAFGAYSDWSPGDYTIEVTAAE